MLLKTRRASYHFIRRWEKHRMRSRPSGFTLVELMVVVAIIGILLSLLLPGIAAARRKARIAAAKQAMSAIGMALDKYRDDFGRYPPDDKQMGTYGTPTGDQAGSEVMFYYLCTRFKWGESFYGPYLDNVGEGRLKESGGTTVKELISPLGGFYKYTQIREKLPDGDIIMRRCLVVDAGGDNIWGGDVDPENGWDSDGLDSNLDNAQDDADNITSSTVVEKK